MKYAVIDIGSNTIRLCIYQAAGTNFRRLFSAKETAGLASYIKKGIMRADGINKAAEVLSYFASILTQFTLKDIYVFATAPLRNISNTLQVTSALYQKTGFDIDVLSGKQEALYSYYGAMHGIQSSDGLLTDIGGGSTELVSFQDGRPTASDSFSIGSLNLYNRLVSDILPTDDEIAAIDAYIEKTLKERLQSDAFRGKLPAVPLLIGVGGTIRGLEKIIARSKGLSAGGLNITRTEIYHLVDCASKRRKDFRDSVLKSCPERIHTLLPGTLIVRQLMKQSGADLLRVSRHGVREGYLKYCLRQGKGGATA